MASDEQRAEDVSYAAIEEAKSMKTKTQKALEDKIRYFREKKQTVAAEIARYDLLISELADLQSVYLKEKDGGK